MTERPEDLAPETINDEQEDEGSQAQTVGEDALDRATSVQGLDDTEKPKGGPTDEDNVTDLVDHMRQMDSSGAIDMSAYDGEETMDDLENRFGTRNAADEQFSEDDS